MKVRVCYTTEVEEQLRLAIGCQWGHEGPATRAEIQEWFRQNGCENCDDILSDYENHLLALKYEQEQRMQRKVTIKRIECTCERCTYVWLAEDPPARCPRCKSPYWNRPRSGKRG